MNGEPTTYTFNFYDHLKILSFSYMFACLPQLCMKLGMLQGQFWKLLDSLKIANFGYFLQTKVTTFGNFIKQNYRTAKNLPVLASFDN